MLTGTVELALAFVLMLLVVYWHQRKRRPLITLLRRNGISGPKPHWIWGNLREYMKTPNVIWDSELTNNYGPICGYYLGAKPVILVTDLTLLEKIQCCQGDKYLDRPRRVPGGINPDPKRAEMLGNLQVPKWKALRTILEKGFSPRKLQNMSLDTQSLIEVLMDNIHEQVDILASKSSPINFYSLYQNLTLDLIGKSGFGLDSDIQRNPNDELKSAVEQEFSKSTSSTILKLYLCFPEFHWILQPIRVALEKLKQHIGLGGHSELWDLGLDTLLQRKREIAEDQFLEKSSDLLNLMIASGKLTDTSVIANSVLFFEAGFETLSASLAFITHLLINHPDVQKVVRNEIKNILDKTGGELENINKLADFKFLDAVIKEGLRMYPPQTTFIGRSGEQPMLHDYHLKSSDQEGTTTKMTCTIPRNVHIQVGLYQILNSADIWEEPRQFRPKRFLGDGLSKEQAMAYQPFGKGKRMCLGRKYADMVLKMVFIQLLSKYQIFAADGNEAGEVDVVYKTATMTPKNGVFGCVVWDPLFSA